MDRLFPGSYGLTPDALAELWPDAIFSFDTNVLLSVYSYSPETRSELLQAMEQVGNRRKVFLTWQVMTEFHRRRMDKIREQDTTADQLTDAFDKLCDAIDDKIKRSDGHHPDVDLERIRLIAEEAREKAAPLLAHTERDRVDPLNDDFLRQITAIFGESIGARPSPEEDQQHRKEGSRRVASKIPPGFADNRKADGGVGDYLIWVELLKLAEKEKLPVIFVTNDRKSDWWEHYERESQEREPIAPRMELVNEMQAHAGVRYHQLLPLEFVRLEIQRELSPVVAKELGKPLQEQEPEPVRYVPNEPPDWYSSERRASRDAAGYGGMLTGGEIREQILREELREIQRQVDIGRIARERQAAALALPVDIARQAADEATRVPSVEELVGIRYRDYVEPDPAAYMPRPVDAMVGPDVAALAGENLLRIIQETEYGVDPAGLRPKSKKKPKK